MRRKRRFTWLPILGETRVSGEGHAVVTQQIITVDLGEASPFPSGFTIPLVGDEGEEESNNTEAPLFINDAVGQDYVIERIVGTIYVAARQSATQFSAYTCCAGLFVGPKDNNDSNAALGDGPTAPYGPLWRNNCDQPWMYRQVWMVGNIVSDMAGDQAGPFEPTNSENSVGPAVDVRSVRRVHKSERLWLSVAAMPAFMAEVGTPSLDPGQVTFFIDLRVLGALRKARNTSTFRA